MDVTVLLLVGIMGILLIGFVIMSDLWKILGILEEIRDGEHKDASDIELFPVRRRSNG